MGCSSRSLNEPPGQLCRRQCKLNRRQSLDIAVLWAAAWKMRMFGRSARSDASQIDLTGNTSDVERAQSVVPMYWALSSSMHSQIPREVRLGGLLKFHNSAGTPELDLDGQAGPWTACLQAGREYSGARPKTATALSSGCYCPQLPEAYSIRSVYIEGTENNCSSTISRA